MNFCSTFRHIHREMYCEELSLKEILNQVERKYGVPQTPLFVYSKRQLHQNVNAYREALKDVGFPCQLNYSVKANPNLTILKELKSLSTSATLVSGHELKLAIAARFEPTALMFNGGGKQYWESHLAVEKGVLLNVDSEWDLRQTLDICQKGFPQPRKAQILFRLNLNIDPQVHKFINTGLSDCKFGLSKEAVESCLRLLEEPGCPVQLVGLHCHLGSTIYQSDVFKSSVEQLLAVRDRLIQRGFTNVNILNVGGGLGIDYLEREAETRAWRSESDKNQNDLFTIRQFLLQKAEEVAAIECQETGVNRYSAMREMASTIASFKDERISFSDLKDSLSALLPHCEDLIPDVLKQCPCLGDVQSSHVSPKDLIASVSGQLQDRGVTLMLEPGRSLVASACVMLSRVLGIKQAANKRYAVVDASMTEIIRPSLYGSYHHISNVETGTNSTVKSVYDVVGPVCESTDFIGKDRLLPDLENSLIAVHDVGAYCQSMASNYNVRMKAAEVLVDGNSCRLIRRRDTFEDFLAPYTNLQ